ncbi:MAG: hypothetical protein ACXWZF_00230 [Actinomycetota bacterium]
MTRARLVLLTLCAPLLLAAADPAGDVAPCPIVPSGSVADAGGGAPDLVAATGEIVELGTSVVFTLRFAGPLVVPDREGRPFRVDIVLLDPGVPPVDAGLYRGVNRILRYDAVRDPVTTTLLLPEGGQSRFIPPTIDGETFVLQVPGRTLVADEDETGTAPGVDELRWGVVVRDEGSCDLLGNGRPTERLIERGETPSVPFDDDVAVIQPGRRDLVAVVVGLAVVLVVGAYVLRRRTRNLR